MQSKWSCGAIVFRDGKFLLLRKKSSGNWEAPKGRKEANETEKQAARREVYEETGLKNLRFIPNFRQVNHYSIYTRGRSIKKEGIFFLAESKRGTVQLSPVHVEYAWLDFETAIRRVKFKNLRKILVAAAQRLDSSFEWQESRDKKVHS